MDELNRANIVRTLLYGIPEGTPLSEWFQPYDGPSIPKSMQSVSQASVDVLRDCKQVARSYLQRSSVKVYVGNNVQTPEFDRETGNVSMPTVSRFKGGLPWWYLSLFHELQHSTIHKLGRQQRPTGMNRVEYAFEEIVADIGSDFLADHVGLSYPVDNTRSYVAGFLNELETGRIFGLINYDRPIDVIIKASKEAARSTDYILTGKL